MEEQLTLPGQDRRWESQIIPAKTVNNGRSFGSGLVASANLACFCSPCLLQLLAFTHPIIIGEGVFIFLDGCRKHFQSGLLWNWTEQFSRRVLPRDAMLLSRSCPCSIARWTPIGFSYGWPATRTMLACRRSITLNKLALSVL